MILWQKASEFPFWGLKIFLDGTEIPKPKKNLLAVLDTLTFLQLHVFPQSPIDKLTQNSNKVKPMLDSGGKIQKPPMKVLSTYTSGQV